MAYPCHYDDISEDYDQLFEWKTQWQDNNGLLDETIQLLNLTEEDIIVDLGSATGQTLKGLASKIKPKAKYVAVDPCPKFMEIVRKTSNFETICTDALDFAKKPINYDVIILRSMVHHIGDMDDIERCLRGIHSQLNPGGRAAIMDSIVWGFPVISEREDITGRLPSDKIMTGIEEIAVNAGFQVESYTIEFPTMVSVDQYKHMLRSRFITPLRPCTEAQIEEMVEDVDSVAKNGNVTWTHEALIRVLRKI